MNSPTLFALCFALSCLHLFQAVSIPSSEIHGLSRQSTLPAGSCQGGTRYMCLDWSFGSERMNIAQSQYRSETFFVVGSYGPGGNLGKCYEFTKFGSFWTFVGQVVNEGTDIKDGQFDMQTGAGGFGIFNGCTRDSEMPTTKSGSLPMFNEDASAFGEEFGGIQSVEECSMAPDFPATGSPPPGEPTVKELCRRSYDWGARNGDITSIRRIKCPLELVSVTGLRLNSDDSDFDPEIRFSGTTTTTMDCCLPAAGYPRTEANTPRFDSDPQYPFVRGCMRDGYTRF